MPDASVLIRGGWVIDPASATNGPADVLVRNGVVAAIGNLPTTPTGRVVDATGLVVAPGFVDVHVHLREPGLAHKETIETGTAAAAAGGFTTVFCMPNTAPALDDPTIVATLRSEIERRALVRVYPIAAITRGRAGREAVDFAALARSGVVGFSDDGDTTADSGIMRRALEASRQLDLPVMVHCEDKGLASGSMHEGTVSQALSLLGSPAEAEEIVMARDLALARLTRGWLHVCHVSIGRGADLVRLAKQAGIRVTAEVMPHHLTMTDDWVAGSRRLVNVDEPVGHLGAPADPNTKVNPPLRPEADTRSLLDALKDGTFDLVSTDHAPHTASEKQGSAFADAASGLSGSEFALPLMLALVRAGHLSVSDVVRLLATAPARLWKLPGGRLTPGAPADIVMFDPEERWTPQAAMLRTKSANTPLLGMELRGHVCGTFVGGEERFSA